MLVFFRLTISHQGPCEEEKLPDKYNNVSLLSDDDDEPSYPSIETKHQLIIGNVTQIPNGQIETTTIVTTTDTRTITTEQQQRCEHDDFVFIPSNLLLYFHAKFAENSRGEIEHGNL